MSLRTKGTRILLGWAILAAASAGGGTAHAVSVGVKGHITTLPGGSPFLYTFELDLQVGTIAPGSSLEVGPPPLGVIGVNTLSGTSQPPYTGPSHSDFWYVPSGGIVTTGEPGPYTTESSITWNYLAGSTYTNSNPDAPIEVALFTVETAYSYPDDAPPSVPGVTVIDYKFTDASGDVTTGSFVIEAPEPSSVILLLAGVGALPLMHRWARRTRSPRAA